MKEMVLYETSKRIVDHCRITKEIDNFDGFIPANFPLEEVSGNLPVFNDATPSDFERDFRFKLFDPVENCFVLIKKEETRNLIKELKGFYSDCYIYEAYYPDKKQRMRCIFQNPDGTVSPRILLPKEFKGNEKIERKLKTIFTYALALQFSLENSFCAYIKPQKNGIGFRIPITDLSACKELFKLRDVPPGEERRKALINFVCEHLRRRPYSDEETLVRKHLRGAERFNWQGFYCEIQSPVGTKKGRQQ